MRGLIFIIAMLLMGVPAFAQKKCPFETHSAKSRHDQYSKSSKKNIEKSKEEMEAQANDFDKKKYQAEVKGKKGVARKNKSVLRYY